LRDIFPNTFILHEDDFYLPEMKWVLISSNSTILSRHILVSAIYSSSPWGVTGACHTASSVGPISRDSYALKDGRETVLSCGTLRLMCLRNMRIPKKYDLLDWDCAGSLSIPDIIKSLEHIHKDGTFPVS
jgi:hypothetical protein